MRRSISLIVSAWLMTGAVACRPPRQPVSKTPPPAVSGEKTRVFENKDAGIRFRYPADWKPVGDKTSLFKIFDPTSKGSVTLSLDVPHLPFHLPGMITPGAVANGYIDDIKKNRIHDAKVDENVDVEVSGAKAKRVKLSGHENGKPSIDVAVLIVQNDKVYILSCDSDDVGYTAARQALDRAAASVEWIK